MISLRLRVHEPELLDGIVTDDERRASLADLRFVNRRLSDSRRFVRTVLPLLDGPGRPRLLDVGCGSADLLGRIQAQSARPLLAVGVDNKRRNLELAPSTVEAVVGDIHRLPFPEGSFDVVMASHVLHHFDTSDLPGILSALYRVARRALVINDLRRSPVPYLFGRVAFPLLFKSRVSVADGLLSIRCGFHSDELAAAFRDAGIPVRIDSCWPYRLLAVAEKIGSGNGRD